MSFVALGSGTGEKTEEIFRLAKTVPVFRLTLASIDQLRRQRCLALNQRPPLLPRPCPGTRSTRSCPFPKLAVYGFQHVLAFYAGAVIVPILLANAIGLSTSS